MTQIFTLKYPVTVKGVETTSLSLRRPKNADIETMETRKGGMTTKTLMMIADLASVDVGVIRELDTEDTGEISAWLEPILDPKGLRSKGDGS